jgi:glutathione synthase/RimK-type ligase-like ATP-grasp enzyme
MDIPMLKTVFGKSDMPYPHIVKEVGGHGGNAVFMVNSDEERDKITGNLLCQACAKDLGVDKRVYILGKEAYIGIKRTAVDGFKSNFSLGGNAEVSTISDEERKIAYALANELDSDFIGVDFVYSDGKPYLNEVEDVVGTRMIYQATKLDPVKAYAKYIEKNI